MSLVVFPFKDEDLEVLGTNLALAAEHARVSEVWAVAAAEGPTMNAAVSFVKGLEGAPVKVFVEERVGDFRPGKGDAMNTALARAADRGFDRVHFYDADITNFGPDWIEGAESLADRGYATIRHRFPRAATDAMVTWMVTRPILAKLFPGTILPRIGQPLGGELLLTRAVVEHLVANPLVSARSDWGIDTMITYATTALALPVYEHHLADGKRHALYGSLDELRTMVIECLDAVISLAGRPPPSARFESDPPAPVPADLKTLTGFDLDRTLPLLTSDWTDNELNLVRQLPDPLVAGLAEGDFSGMDAPRWGHTLDYLIENFVLGDPGWEGVVFRLWLSRVLAYTTGPAADGYDRAIEYLESTVSEYEQF